MGSRPLMCMHCHATHEVVRELYPNLDCNIRYVCVAPFCPLFFSENKKSNEEYNLLYWPARLNGRVVLTPSFNLHTAEGREDYEHFLADNDNHIELEQLRQDRLDEVVMWMNHTFFYEAYVSEGECQFNPSFDRLKNCQTRSDLWRGSGFRMDEESTPVVQRQAINEATV